MEDSVLIEKLFNKIDKLNTRISLLEFNNKGLGESCEKHMQTIDNLKVSLVDMIARVKRARSVLQTERIVGESPSQWFILSTVEQEALLERIKKNENIYSTLR